MKRWIVLSLSILLSLTALPNANAAAKVFKNCTELNMKYPGGVALPGAVNKGLCKNGCGQKLVQQCIPLMKEYGIMENEILDLNHNLEQMSQRQLQFQEYRKAKEQYKTLSEKEKKMVNSNVAKQVEESKKMR